MIEVKHLGKTFPGKGKRGVPITAVEDVSLSVADGRISALLGPNGAGKTTTMRILATLMQADRGTAHVGGCNVATQALAVRAQLGVLSDARGLYTRLTARENVAYHAALRGIDADTCDKRLLQLAGLLDMQALLDRRTEGFSTGEKMKVALARALIHDPQHLILDEPTNGLDVMSTRALRRLLQTLRDAGKCILFSTHLMQEVESLCDHIIIVAHGRNVAQGSAQELRDQASTASLEDAFVTLALSTSEPEAHTA